MLGHRGTAYGKVKFVNVFLLFYFFKDISGVKFGSLVTNYDQIWRHLRLWLTIGPKAVMT